MSSANDLAERVFTESKFAPGFYLHGFKEDVARAIHAGKLDGIAQEQGRIVAMLEADAAEWLRASEAFHAFGDFEAEEAARNCVTILRGVILKIRAKPL